MSTTYNRIAYEALDVCNGVEMATIEEAVARTGNGPSLLNTLSEVALLASTQMLVSPAASSSTGSRPAGSGSTA